jgi:hypothetical protein
MAHPGIPGKRLFIVHMDNLVEMEKVGKEAGR